VVSQALLGFKREITHLDGHVFTVERTEITQPGAWRRRRRGAPLNDPP